MYLGVAIIVRPIINTIQPNRDQNHELPLGLNTIHRRKISNHSQQQLIHKVEQHNGAGRHRDIDKVVVERVVQGAAEVDDDGVETEHDDSASLVFDIRLAPLGLLEALHCGLDEEHAEGLCQDK